MDKEYVIDNVVTICSGSKLKVFYDGKERTVVLDDDVQVKIQTVSGKQMHLPVTVD